MRPSLRLGKFAGINVGLHWSIALIAVFLTFSLAGTILPATAPGLVVVSYWAAAILTTALFLASIVAHELGHSLVAQRNDIGVDGITLFALGGVAVLEDEPKTPGAAARIALAGPAVSLALGVGAFLAAAGSASLGLSPLATGALQWLGIINVILAVFNMLPALPLDGGRVLQAALWSRKGNRHRATIGAATVGRFMGWAMVAVGLWQFTNGGAGLWTAFIGMFIISNAKAEQARAKILLRQEQGRGWPFADLFGPNPDAFGPPRAAERVDLRTDPTVVDDVIDVDSWEADRGHRTTDVV
ncbi:MAG: Zn-dependent protease [Acidimicrobiales bacterium]|jgi:Zn-dependent protease